MRGGGRKPDFGGINQFHKDAARTGQNDRTKGVVAFAADDPFGHGPFFHFLDQRRAARKPFRHFGSGLFRLGAMRAAGIRCGLGTDVGGGTSLSLLRTANEAYKVLHLQEHALPAMQALYLATLGAAEALHLDQEIGNFAPGKEADFAVLDFAGSNITARRTAAADSIEEKLFALMTLGDDRNIAATYVLGRGA